MMIGSGMPQLLLFEEQQPQDDEPHELQPHDEEEPQPQELEEQPHELEEEQPQELEPQLDPQLLDEQPQPLLLFWHWEANLEICVADMGIKFEGRVKNYQGKRPS